MSPTEMFGEFISSLIMLGLMVLGVLGLMKMDKLTKNKGLLGHLCGLSTSLGMFLLFQSFILPEEKRMSRIVWGLILIAVGLFIFRKISRNMNEDPAVPSVAPATDASAGPVPTSVVSAPTATDASAAPAAENHTQTATTDDKKFNKKLLQLICAFMLTAFGLLTQTYFIFAGLGWMVYIVLKK